MKVCSTVVLALLCTDATLAFLSPLRVQKNIRLDGVKVFSSLKEDETKEETKVEDSLNGATSETPSLDPDAEGLPWWWELVWKLDVMKKGVPGEEIIFGDSANVLRTNIEQIYGGVRNSERRMTLFTWLRSSFYFWFCQLT
jgi:hypothetical protein